MSVLSSVLGVGATGLPTVIVCVAAAEQTSGSEKKEQARHKLKQAFFFFSGIILKWHLFGGFCFVFFVLRKSLSDAVLWIICLERVNSLLSFFFFIKPLYWIFSKLGQRIIRAFPPLFSHQAEELWSKLNQIFLFFPPDFFKNPRHQCCRGVVAQCYLDITVNPAALGLIEIS